MKFSVDKKEFYSVISKAGQASNERSTLPIFGCILLDVQNNSITLSGADGVLSIKSTIPCDVSRAGKIGVNTKILCDVVDKLSDEIINVELIGNKIRVGNKKAAVNIVTVESLSFVPLPNYQDFVFQPCTDLFDAVKKVKFVVKSKTGDRPYLSGVCIDNGKAVATDGHRLSVAAHTVIQPNSYIIDGDGLNRAYKALDKEVGVFVDENRVHFKSGDTYISVALIAGKYPNYTQFIPGDDFSECSIDKAELEFALNLLDAVADSKSRTIILSFENNKLNLISTTEQADSSQDIDIEFNGNMRISFDLKYLIEAIKQLNSDKVIMELRSPTSPAIIKEEGYIHVIMPKRI